MKKTPMSDCRRTSPRRTQSISWMSRRSIIISFSSSRNNSKIRPATGAAVAPPPPPYSTRTVTTIRGLSRGANPENQEWVLISRPARASRSALSRLMTWVEPVLPQTSSPSTRAALSRAAVVDRSPHAGDDALEERLLERVRRSGRRRGGAALPAPAGGAGAEGRCFPLMAMRAVSAAICSGVTWSCPWPMATEIVSPGYQGSPRTFLFHSELGTSPSFSPARSMPVLAPRPIRPAALAISSMSMRRPSW